MRQNSIDQGTTSDSVESNTTEKNDSASSSSSSVTSSCSSSSSLLPSYRLLPPPSFPSSSSPSQRRRKCIVTTVWSCSKIYIFTFHDSSGNSVGFHTQDIYVPITIRWVIFFATLFFREERGPLWRKVIVHSKERKLLRSNIRNRHQCTPLTLIKRRCHLLETGS